MRMNKCALVSSSLVFFLSACGQVVIEPRDYSPSVKALTVGEDGNESGLYYPAIARAADRSMLSFRVSGEISKLLVKEGTRVNKGDVIAQLDTTDYRLKVENSQAKYNVADSQYRRSAKLVKQGYLAQSQFDELAAQRAMAKAELDLVKLRLSYTQLTSPIDGIISRVAVDQFENVQVGQPVVNVHRIDVVEVVVQVPDRIFVSQPKDTDFSNVSVNVRVSKDLEYSAHIKEFTTEPDPETATYNLTLVMPMPQDNPILDGAAVEVGAKNNKAAISFNRGVTVPLEAIFNQDGDSLDRSNKFVWVLNKDNTVSKTKIKTGKVSIDQVQVLEGLSAGQQVIIAGVARLRDGMSVELIEQEASL